jgi:DNA polymerase III alpha subunit (gram-positive type)
MNNLQAMIDKIKSKVTNPYLRDNLTLDNISNFFANFIAGNEFLNNLEVKELADFNKVEVRENFKSKGEAHMESLNTNKLTTKAMMITDNEIIFDPEASLKMRESNIEFKVKDIFEVITFMKFIVNICGSKLEKCDFDTLLKNHNANQLMQILNKLNKKQEEMQQEKVKQEQERLKQEQEKLKLEQEKLKKEEENKKKQETDKKKDSNTEGKETAELNSYKFRESTTQIGLNEEDLNLGGSNNELGSDYSKFLSTPEVSDLMNNYYYQMPYYNNNNNLF